MNLKHLSEYRDQVICQRLVEQIARINRHDIRLMEVCGTHTMAIARNGIRELLPSRITLLSGPGCPVCVTAQSEVDQFIQLARIKDVIVVTFGDLMRVPGSNSSLAHARAEGCDVRVVYSALDSLDIAEQNPRKNVVFLGVGFETTAPTVAASVLEARRRQLNNFFLLSAHKLVPPALHALLQDQAVRLNGLICPGHVSVIIGARAYKPFSTHYQIPCVIAGFEPADILQAILLLVQQIEAKTPAVEIAYRRGVSPEGNVKAREIMKQVFDVVPTNWRGFGSIPLSGLKLKDEFQQFDAVDRFSIVVTNSREPAGCICGAILRGVQTPADCPLFQNVCTPENPVGPCMVSSEGTCAAFYRYRVMM